ncbi:DinB family protein [Paenibacillus glycanilyticus]|uniref:DinB-like domain-containing protein n=1 Tax=Paenibacillus glycanilyticus TaxID=126569 RepID=A0ABQ6GA85_9BACL|nr:DinB family protein [Paenibacillus glycanilyticus]GLX66587.1 hypothetical protein MU1_09310 [Paenibacillus glycanilyticus]
MSEKRNQFEEMIEEFLALKKYPEDVLTDPIATGKWSIREIVGHLFYWDKFSLEKMVPLMIHEATLPPFPNHDLHNEEGISYINRYDSVNDIIDEFAKTRKQLVEELRKLNNDIRFNIGHESNTYSCERYVDVFLHHDNDHLNQIKEKLNC